MLGIRMLGCIRWAAIARGSGPPGNMKPGGNDPGGGARPGANRPGKGPGIIPSEPGIPICPGPGNCKEVITSLNGRCIAFSVS